MTDASAGIDALLAENRTFPPPERVQARRPRRRDVDVRRGGRRTTRGSGPGRPPSCSTGTPSGTRSASGSCRTPSGSSAGKLNVAHNCLDRHVAAGRGDKVAIHFEGEPGDTRAITYAELLDEVQRFANALKGLGVATGDRVNIYLPMIPEAAVAMLACARIGAAHSVVFGGFSSQALADRINDAEAKVLITADGG